MFLGGGLDRDDGGVLPDAYLHLVREKKRPLENELFTTTMSRLSRKDKLPFKERNQGFTVINLVM